MRLPGTVVELELVVEACGAVLDPDDRYPQGDDDWPIVPGVLVTMG